jgi:hypothetical protein
LERLQGGGHLRIIITQQMEGWSLPQLDTGLFKEIHHKTPSKQIGFVLNFFTYVKLIFSMFGHNKYNLVLLT